VVKFEIEGTVVQLLYETAIIPANNAFMSLRRGDRTHELEANLANAAGARVDNKTVYVITPSDGSPVVYIMFWDLQVCFGHSIRMLK
jgi:hypothetical protein